MYPAPTECPVCKDELLVTGLECRNCGTSLVGRFATGRLAQLASEQLHFVEVFIRCEGKLNRVQQELGLSYPTVRSRLEDVIRGLGYPVGDDRMKDGADNDDVLARLSRQEISAEEALELI
jgi:hypothetical protein